MPCLFLNMFSISANPIFSPGWKVRAWYTLPWILLTQPLLVRPQPTLYYSKATPLYPQALKLLSCTPVVQFKLLLQCYISWPFSVICSQSDKLLSDHTLTLTAVSLHWINSSSVSSTITICHPPFSQATADQGSYCLLHSLGFSNFLVHFLLLSYNSPPSLPNCLLIINSN